MLVEHGADTSLLRDASGGSTLIEKAVDDGNEYTAACFRGVEARNGANAGVAELTATASAYSKHIHQHKEQAAAEAVESLKLAKPGQDNQDLFCSVMVSREYHRVGEFARRGTTFFKVPGSQHPYNLDVLVKNGFAALVH